MDMYERYFPAIKNLFISFDDTMVYITIMLILFSSFLYIVLTIINLKRIFQNLDFSFAQSMYIFIRLVIISFLIYVDYEIIRLIIIISQS